MVRRLKVRWGIFLGGGLRMCMRPMTILTTQTSRQSILWDYKRAATSLGVSNSGVSGMPAELKNVCFVKDGF